VISIHLEVLVEMNVECFILILLVFSTGIHYYITVHLFIIHHTYVLVTSFIFTLK
jgi:uncharacterized membrane protein